ncbi:MAG: hypothetical protein JWO22_3691, partial [Frankiales bacterium]|nr:hypothetical protein [Frankiales bacterium]
MSSFLRRSALLVSGTAALVALSTSAAFACPPILPGVKAAQAVYNQQIRSIGKTSPSALVGTRNLTAASVGSKPNVLRFDGTLTRNPDSNSAPALTTPSNACALPTCKELDVVVPKGSSQTLYARVTWPATTQYVQIWGVSPTGAVVGKSAVGGSVDKRVGNADVAPVAEFTVPDPAAGTWKIQVRAVFGVSIPVKASVALVKAPALQMPTLDVTELADHYLTQDLTYNIVMVNRTWKADELAAFKAVMPTEYRSAVLVKQSDDGCSNAADPPADQAVSGSAGTLANWGTSYYCGTNGTGNKPYFEPVKFRIHYRYLEANKVWTRDLFAEMKKDTRYDQPFSLTGAVGNRRQTQGQYLANYNSSDGLANRGADHAVANPEIGDKIDAFKVEDWIFAHRLDNKYGGAFKDVSDSSRHSGAFINPDPNAYFDPFYTGKGTKNLDVAPQGGATSVTFFALDTYGSNADGDFTAQYFRPTAYHFFDVSEHMVDPDLKEGSGPDMARAWGGRYRFFLHDMGAGPNAYESADTALTQNYGGSATYPFGDPPIWDYENNPQWSGQLGARTARDARIWLFSRFLGSYLYRPVPADVYLLADSNWQDCDSNPQCSASGISYTDLSKIYHEAYVKKNLGAALPGATFNSLSGSKGFVQDKHLGCSADMVYSPPNPEVGASADDRPAPTLIPNPQCVGKTSDPLQELLEKAKAGGDELTGVGQDVAANPAVVRAYVEAHRSSIAPQPAGQFTLTNIDVVWPGATTWALPALVGGIAVGTPNGEGWGNLNNVNDRVKTTTSTVCSRSLPVAPGCNGVPPISAGGGFSYTIEHESSHFLGLLHPHDYVLVSKDSKGKFDYYGDGFAKYADFSMAPTTYAGAFAPYSVLDQDIIQRGHTAEYLRQAQDYLADAYLVDGMNGHATITALTKAKQTQSGNWRSLSSSLFACGDYLHAEHAMRNAALAAQGVFGPIVKPRALKAGERVLFSVDGQTSYDVDGKVSCVGAQSASAPTRVGGGTPTTA